MTSMMMLDITMEVSVNNTLPKKGKAQRKLGQFFLHFSAFDNFG